MLLLGVGEGQTGLLQTALTLPFILFAIPAGLLADRISRRWLMAGAEALRAAALLAILLLIWLGQLTLPLLALLGFVAVCGTVVYSVAAPALVPSLVAPQLLPAANARIELARTIAFASGPALGGVLVGWVGAAPAFGFAAALSVVAVVLLSGIYEPARAAGAAPPSAAGHQGRRRLRAASSRCCGRCSSPSSSSTPHPSCCSRCSCPMRCAISDCRRPASAPRWRCTASAWWSARWLATRVMRRLPFGIVIGLGPGDRLCRRRRDGADHGRLRRRCSRALSFFLLGAGPILWVISTTTLRQSVTPPRLLGRVSAINIMSYGARPLGSALGAIVGGFYGAEACLYLAVAIFGAQALVILLSPAVSLARQPEMVGEPAKA